MSNNLTPAKIIPPGQILNRELVARGWTQKHLAEITNLPLQVIDEIVKGTKQITLEIAIYLSAAFGTSAEFWTKLEANYQLYIVKKKQKAADNLRRIKLSSLVPLSELIKRQWIVENQSLDELEQQVCKLLEISSIEEEPQLEINFSQSQKPKADINYQITWVQRVKYLVKKQTVADFQLNKLKASIPEIIACTKTEQQIANVPTILASLGVYFVILPHLSKTHLDGATFYLDDKPVIALTLRYKRIHNFWFALMHELGHIVAEHQGIYLDNFKKKEDNEKDFEASQLAKNWLIPPDHLAEFVANNDPKFSMRAITNFAQTINRHPGIIIGRLHHDGLMHYKNLYAMLVQVDSYLSEWTNQ